MSNRESRALADERALILEEMSNMIDASTKEERAFSEDEQATFDSLNKQAESLQHRWEAAYAYETAAGAVPTNPVGTASVDPVVPQEMRSVASADLSKPGKPFDDPSREKRQQESRQAFRAWAMGKRARRADLEVADRIGFDVRSDVIDLDFRLGLFGNQLADTYEERQQQTDTDGAGGFLVPEDFSNEFERALKDFSGMRQISRIVTTASGAAFQWPSADDTGARATIVAEGAASSVTDVTFTNTTFNAFTYRSLMQSSRELLQDSFTDIPALLGSMLGERLGRGLNADFTVGTDSGEPAGAVQTSTANAALATDNAPTYDEMVDLIHSIDPAYRASPSFAIMASDTVVANLRKLKDSQNNPIWNTPVAAGMPPTFLGVPVITNNDVPTAAATGTKSIACGDFSRYIIRDVAQQGVQIQRLDELYAANALVGFLLFSRHDGRIVIPAHGAIKHNTNP